MALPHSSTGRLKTAKQVVLDVVLPSRKGGGGLGCPKSARKKMDGCSRLIGLLVGWFVGWLVSWLVG